MRRVCAESVVTQNCLTGSTRSQFYRISRATRLSPLFAAGETTLPEV
jgi:hypothetical protein